MSFPKRVGQIALFFSAIFFLQGTLSWAISVQESKSQKNLKGRYYNPTKLEWPKFDQPNLDLSDFDQMAEEQDKAWGRTPSSRKQHEEAGRSKATEEEMLKDPRYQAMMKMAEDISQGDLKNSAAGTTNAREAANERFKEIYQESLRIKKEADQRAAKSAEEIAQLERG